jgi:nicotinate dehydrogenase subunit B
MNITRREFLKTGGALVVTFPLATRVAEAAGAAPAKSVATNQVDGFLSVDAKGLVTVYSGKVDLGTGIRTAMTQIAAEELCVPLDRVRVVQGDTQLTPDQGVTFGSLSIQNGGMQIRQAAATARQALVQQAAVKLGTEPANVVVRNGIALSKDGGGPGITYADLVGGYDFQMEVDPKAPLKDPKEYTIVGRSVQRLDIPDKVTGRFTYMQDFKLPGMIHARVVRPAAMKASLVAFNDFGCKKIPGYIGAVRKGNFLAVLAKDEWSAIKAAKAIDTQWSEWTGLPDQSHLWDYIRTVKVNKTEAFQNVGNTRDAFLASSNKLVSAVYDFAPQTHGSLGPSCAVAKFEDGKLTSWSASQATHLLRKQMANMLEMKPEDVRCVYIEGAGCYGRNGHEDAAADAALIAREVGGGIPVRVQWMRQDEHGWDPKGPPTLLDHKAALDDKGNLVAWESNVYIPERPKDIVVTLVAADHAGLPKEDSHPGNIHASLAIPYTVANVTCQAKWLAETPFRPSWIRTPGRMQNTFANESFIDELAALAGVDPLEYRLRYLQDPRGRELLERVAKLAKYEPRKGPRDSGEVARGRGISYTKYELVRTYVGVVADVEVNRRTGHVQVTNFFVAHDCGQIINPDGLRNQIEGNVVQTVGRTLYEELKFDRSKVTSLDWSTYRTVKFPDVPAIAIDLVDRPNEKPWGAGEPTAAVVPSAIANAIFDATGARLRSVPFTPQKVLAGLKTA